MRNVAQVLKAPLQQQQPAAVEVPLQRELEVMEVPSQQKEPAEVEAPLQLLLVEVEIPISSLSATGGEQAHLNALRR